MKISVDETHESSCLITIFGTIFIVMMIEQIMQDNFNSRSLRHCHDVFFHIWKFWMTETQYLTQVSLKINFIQIL